MICWLLGWLLFLDISTHGLGYYSSANVNACSSFQKVRCSSSSCDVNGTSATLGDGRQLSCFVSFVQGSSEETGGPSPRLPESVQASCYKTFSERLGKYKPVMDITWESKETDLRNQEVTGYSLFIRGAEYTVYLELKGPRRDVKVAECIKFIYICYGVNNLLLFEGTIVTYSVYSAPRSSLFDKSNGRSGTYVVPEVDECRARLDETNDTLTSSTTRVDPPPDQDPQENGNNLVVVIGIVLAVVLAIALLTIICLKIRRCLIKPSKEQQQPPIIPQPSTQEQQPRSDRSKSSTRGRQPPVKETQTPRTRQQPSAVKLQSPMQTSDPPLQDFPPPIKRVLVVIDRTKRGISNEAHALVQNLRQKTYFEIKSSLENKNPIIHEQREVTWYQENSDWADTIIFVNGVAVLRKLGEYRNFSDEFTHAIFSHFNTKKYAQKRNIFLENNQEDIEYIEKEQKWPRCWAFHFNKNLGADDDFHTHLSSCAQIFLVNERGNAERQQGSHFQTSGV